jgi:N-acetylgalactosamine kinase
LASLGEIQAALLRRTTLDREAVNQIVGKHCGEKAARSLATEIWGKGAEARSLNRRDFAGLFSPDERLGRLRIGKETIPVKGMLERFDQMNLSTYLFRAPVLYDGLGRLKSVRASQEEYLTDIFALLEERPKPARVIGCEIRDPRELMAYNNPQELLAIEEVFRQKEGQVALQTEPDHAERLAVVSVWDNLLSSPSTAARKEFNHWYGGEIPWQRFRDTLAAFAGRYGSDRPTAIVRSPGRINLMGRHIDHQGGTVNVMAVNREIVLVAAPRNDDVVSLANMDGFNFCSQSFRISDLVSNLNWDDWQKVIDGPRLQRLLEGARGDWANYVKAAILRLQEQFRDRRLRGLDIMVSGDIPMGAGLSSSSALVVAAAEVVRLFNRLPVSPRRLVSLCGEGEWFVGTRGGAADHAAIRTSRYGQISRFGFFPFRMLGQVPFSPELCLVIAHSGSKAAKSADVRDIYNQRVASYDLA